MNRQPCWLFHFTNGALSPLLPNCIVAALLLFLAAALTEGGICQPAPQGPTGFPPDKTASSNQVSRPQGLAPNLPPIRVALMDFSTDDNSYRNAGRAADFTSLLQLQLATEPGLDWIERAQLALAGQELKLSEMDLLSGAAPLRRGKWAKADWLITGQFSLDAQSRRCLWVEIIDLQHADVLANGTITWPDTVPPEIPLRQDQVAFAAKSLRDFLSQARARHQQTGRQALVAMLFLEEVGPFSFFWRDGLDALERPFGEALERMAATNTRVRLIRFPKAYRALGEAEMVLDGLVQAHPEAWQQTADLYVWGTYGATNRLVSGKREQAFQLTLQVWDGVSPPVVFQKEQTLPVSGRMPATQLAALLDQLAAQILAQARPQSAPPPTAAVRHQIANAIVQAYRQRSGGPGSDLALHNEEKFLQTVHLLETACFFDPDNAEAQVHRLTCRWGWWMEFDSYVKNQFWSKWRRSQAWGNYVERFGLGPVPAPLPFPYRLQGGIPQLYVNSLEEVLRHFPQGDQEELAAPPDAQTWSPLKGAQAHGFPKEIPPEAIRKWKTQLEAELVQRQKRVEEFRRLTPPTTNTWAVTSTSTSTSPRPAPGVPSAALSRSNRPGPAPLPHPGQTAAGPLPSSPASPPAARPRLVSAPAWFNECPPTLRLFQLTPPQAWPPQIEPAAQTFSFPPQFRVQAISQLACCRDKLLILALDEGPAPASDPLAAVTDELRTRRGRLWHLGPEERNPTLFEAGLLPANLRCFLPQEDRLWVGGPVTGWLNWQDRRFHPVSLAEGLTVMDVHALSVAAGRLAAAGGRFDLCLLDPASPDWKSLQLPSASLRAGTDNPYLLAGNREWLGYVAGATLLYHVPTATWTNLPLTERLRCALADETGFWFGSDEGLHHYSLKTGRYQSWQRPKDISGLSNPLSGLALLPFRFGGPPEARQDQLEVLDERLQNFLRRFARERQARLEGAANRLADPLRLDWHLSEEVTALADEGEFLWLGTGGQPGRVLLLHKPDLALVACCKIDGPVAALAVSSKEVWVGAAYGHSLLTRLRKADFLAVPRRRWTDLAVSPAQRSSLVRGLSRRDQAVYAFYAGDHARVAELWGNENPRQASLETLFLLAFSYDAAGLDRPELARAWFEHIQSRYPGSPWAKAAGEFLAANQFNHQARQRALNLLARYDRNHNGVLDPAERQAMAADSAYQREQSAWQADQLERQIAEVIQRFDRNADRELDREELEFLRGQVVAFSAAPPEMLAGRKIPVAPFLTKQCPSVAAMLKRYDANHNGRLDATELKAMAKALHNSE